MEVDDYCMRYSTVHDRPSVCVVGKDCGQMGPARTVGWGTTGRMGMNKLITPSNIGGEFHFLSIFEQTLDRVCNRVQQTSRISRTDTNRMAIII